MFQFSGAKRPMSSYYEKAPKFAKRKAFKIKRSTKTDISRRATRFNQKANIEWNFVDTGQLSGECSTTGSIQLLNTIPQGTTVNQRVGKRLLLRSLRVQGFFQPASAAIYNNFSALIVLDRQSNGAAIPAITDILVSANADDFPNDAKRSRYKILRRFDCVISGATLVAAAAPPSDLPSANVDAYIPLNFVMEFNTSATTGVQATIEKGAMYLITVGSSATGTTSGSFFGFFRTRFTEDF